MRFVCTSDIHNRQGEITMPEGDCLIIAGDMTGTGDYQQLYKFGQWLSFQDYKHKVIIAGNHDIGLQEWRDLILNECFPPDVIYLEDSGVELEGIKIYGTPWMPFYNDWAFMKEEWLLAPHYNAIPDDTEILITHCPPNSILDLTLKDCRYGSTNLYERIKRLPALRHHVFGHIHESAGIEVIGDVTFHNVAALDRSYQYKNPPQVFDYDTRRTG